MDESTADATIERINRLEKSLTHVWLGFSLLGIVTAALIGFVVVLLSAHPSSLATVSAVQGRVSAREFVVTDANGKPVAWFGSLTDGFSGFILAASGASPSNWEPPAYIRDLLKVIEIFGGSYLIAGGDQTELSLEDRPGDKNKADGISLSVNSNPSGVHESALRLSGRDGMTAFSGIERYGAKSTENASFSLFAGNFHGGPERHTELELDVDGSSYLEFGKILDPRARLEIDAQGLPALNLFDKNGEGRARFALTASGDPFLTMWGKGEKTYGGTYLRHDGLTLEDEQGKVRVALGSTILEKVRTGATETTAPGSLTLFDKNGRVMWQAPPQ